MNGIRSPSDGVKFWPSQIGVIDEELPYTGSPWKLLQSEMKLIWGLKFFALGVLFPWRWKEPDPMDELYLNWTNIKTLSIHAVLFVGQTVFLGSLPIAFVGALFMPGLIYLIYVAIFFLVNWLLCRVLNGSEAMLTSQVDIQDHSKDNKEYWIFINGVAVGRDWLQSNIDRLSLTFGRKITGVHNPTSGILFDLVQCLVQRTLCFYTQDVRDAYTSIKKTLQDDSYERVVFILHSQGGIEGGLVVDWLLNSVPHDVLHKLEIYTFGNAANHFNNPHRTLSALRNEQRDKAAKSDSHAKIIRHIEHYANAGDFVSQYGVCNFIDTPMRFMGRLFMAPSSGHLLNSHYLHSMFPLTPDRTAAEDVNEFMEMEVSFTATGEEHATREGLQESFTSTFGGGDNELAGGGPHGSVAFLRDVNSPIKRTISFPDSPVAKDRVGRAPRVRDFSRLWLYRNGRTPPM